MYRKLRYTFGRLLFIPVVLATIAVSACNASSDPASPQVEAVHGAALSVPSSSWAEGIDPTEGFLARQAEYLEYCSNGNGPGQGGIHGQVCRLATNAGDLNETVIRNSLEEINNREDTADFDLNSVLRLLALYSGHPNLDPALEQDMRETVLNFKYWLDEPGPDMMCWWSENHQLLFHTAELVAGQLYPDTVFPNSGMTGAEHVAHAIPMLHDWLDHRGRFGFSEWHSNVYFNEDMPPLINLVDLAQDEEIATKAAMVLDVMAFDFANTYYKGIYATTHGRTYESKQIGGSNDSTAEAAWILLDLGTYHSTDNFSGAFLATSPRYWPPAILEDIAADALDQHVDKQRDSIDVAQGPDYGIGYEDFDDIMFWWGMTGYATSPVISGTFEMVDYYDLWDNYFWSDVAFLKPLVGSPLLEPLSAHLDDITRGPALETVNTYVYRTPYYQLSGAQNYNPGMWGAQQHIWQATIDADAVVFTTYPGGMEGDYMAGNWTGGWLPRALFYENIGELVYEREHYRKADQEFFVEYTHAYFPQWAFDRIEQSGNWTLAQKGDAYIALYSDNPVQWATQAPENEYELIANGFSNVWIVELGSKPVWGSFDNFMSRILAARTLVNGNVVDYNSPSQGDVEVSADGQLFIEGIPADTGPYDRWDNAYAHQEFGTTRTVIGLGGQRLILDFAAPLRSYQAY